MLTCLVFVIAFLVDPTLGATFGMKVAQAVVVEYNAVSDGFNQCIMQLYLSPPRPTLSKWIPMNRATSRDREYEDKLKI